MKSPVKKYFSRRPDVCHGKLCFKGTRIPVSQVLSMIEGGDSIDDILAGYPSLTKRAIQAALHLASELVDSDRPGSRARAA